MFWLTDHTRQCLFRMAEEHLRDQVGISISQAGALIMIGTRSPIAMRDLAKSLRIGQPAVTGLVRRLELRGLTRRLHDPSDARVQRLALTDAGEEATGRARILLEDLNARVEKTVPAEDLPVVIEFLERFAEGIAVGPTEDDSGVELVTRA